jgi:phage shock protein PspC (stress-responsive transcriptional regulator)
MATGCRWPDPGNMNDAPPGGSSATQGGHPGTDSFFDSLRRIDMRRTEDGWIGGVAAGLARRLAIDPLVVRAGFVLLGLFFGFGVLLYLLAWLLVPDTRNQTHLERAMRQGDGTSIVLFVITVLVAVSSLPWWGDDGWWGGWWFGSLLLLALIVWAVWSLWERRSDAGPVGSAGTAGMTSTPPPPPPGAAGGPAAGPSYAASTGTAGGYPTGPGSPPPGPAAPYAAVPPTPPPPPAPPRPRRRSGGPMAGLLATGLALVTYGSLTWAGDAYDWPGNTYVVAVAGTLAVLGLFVLVLGLAGRKGGFPGFLAALALVVTAVTAPLPETLNLSGGVGDRVWAPTTVAELDREPFRLGVGEGTLDLRGLDPDELDGQEVVASVGIGQLVVIVPEDITVRLRASSAVGNIDIDPSDFGEPTRSVSGAGVSEDRVLGAGEPDLVLDVSVGLGEVHVERN